MSSPDLSKEERILKMMKRVLTDVAKDTSTQAGLKHPLTDQTIQGIRECLALIAAREAELAREHERPAGARPRFADEQPKSVVVPLVKVDARKKHNPDDQS